MYSPLEKSFLSLACLPCFALLVLIYWYAKRSLINESERVSSRMELWYACMAGAMLGIFIFRTLPQSAAFNNNGNISLSYRELAAFVMLGFYALMWVDKVGRVCAYNPVYFNGLSIQEASDENANIELLLNRQDVTMTDYHESNNVYDEQFPQELHELQVTAHVITRRQRDALLLCVLMSFVCIVEGLYLIYRQDVALGGKAGIVACFYIDKLLETLVVGCIMIYGMFHSLSRYRSIYWLISTLWCIVIVMSVVPVLNDTSMMEITNALQHPAMAICYAISAGFIFYISIFFIFSNRIRTDRKEMITRVIVFGAGLAISFVTGMFM